jgi:hypothetical protein
MMARRWSSAMLPQAAISASVLPHPMHSWDAPLTMQTLMQGVETGASSICGFYGRLGPEG